MVIVTSVPTFRPTIQDCEGSWEKYIKRIEPKFRECGICKVVPPREWQPSRGPGLEEREVAIKRPIEQRVTGRQGVFRALLLTRKEMSLQDDFKPLTLQPDNQPPKGLTGEDLEREFWRSTHRIAPIYGADVEASFFDADLQAWNLHKLDSLLTRVLENRIPGVNTPYLYFGMWRSFFGWHTEDMELHSVNYLHYGAPKQWYCIPPKHRQRFETWVKGLLPDCFRACSEFFRHKELLISPKRLKDASIPFVKLVQQPGEMVINYPGAYHSGFNCGFNCAESTNFATLAWIAHGAEADCCTCREDAVNIDMRHFLPWAKRATRAVIERNFVSDSESEDAAASSSSGPDDDILDDITSDSAEDEDPSSDYLISQQQSRSRGRRASSIGQRKRKRKELLSLEPQPERGEKDRQSQRKDSECDAARTGVSTTKQLPHASKARRTRGSMLNRRIPPEMDVSPGRAALTATARLTGDQLCADAKRQKTVSGNADNKILAGITLRSSLAESIRQRLFKGVA